MTRLNVISIGQFAGISICFFLTLTTFVNAHPLFYLSTGIGQAMYDSSTDKDPKFVGNVDESATSWTFSGGVNVNEYLTVEAGYVDLDELEYNGSFLGTPDQGTVKTSGWEAVVIGKYPVNQALNINLIAKVGFFVWDSDETEIFGGAQEPKFKDDGEDLMYGLGIQGGVLNKVDLRLEWNRYTDVAKDDIDSILLRTIYSF